ncbi:MAG: MFS transporter [Thermoplasmata archaeon]|nr:MFS transporter [Thermoplasmata archaeon]
MKYKWVILATFWFMIFSYGANWFAVAPLLHDIETTFGIDHASSHLLLSIIGLFVVFFAWPAGSLADRKGLKITSTIGAAFMALGFGARAIFWNGYLPILITTMIAGIGLAWLLVALAPTMIEWFGKRSSLAVGIASSGLFLGFSFGSVTSPYLYRQGGLETVFIFFGILAVIAFIIWLVAGKDAKKTGKKKAKKFSEGLKEVLASKNAWIYPIIGFFIVGATLAASALMPRMHAFGDIEKGYIISIMLLGAAIGAFSIPHLASKYGVKKTSVAVSLLALLSWLLFYLDMPFFALMLVSFIFGVFLQASWPIALHSQETEKGVTAENAGIAASLYISISNIGGAVLPVITGWLENDINLAYMSIAVYVALFLIAWIAVRR